MIKNMFIEKIDIIQNRYNCIFCILLEFLIQVISIADSKLLEKAMQNFS